MKRILTAVVLIPIVLLLVLRAPFWLITVVSAGVACLTAWEYLGIADTSDARPPRVLTLLSIATLFFCAFRNADLIGPAIGGLALILFIFCAFRSPLDRVLRDTATAVFGLIYIGFTLTTIPLLSAQENGPSLLLLLLLVVWSGDIAALYVGKSLGRRKLAPRLSPNKTWEGAIASVAGGLLVTAGLVAFAAFLARRGIELVAYPGSLLHWLLLALILNVAAQVGDLAESAIKRGAGVKDSGTLLPGHGGILDRIDALLLAAPALWYAQLVQQWF
ncbi:Phosphatidate cytidylyltransferase [Acidisarcina polymorpha]|uniref:Phosphatidate cytidylyltransferase n=1 Tax=Acidisarcina polymorpha TaxID=2211140 RepID=A0A2Z5FTJ5_9BACT|nr:CDP-archaeol synthase [Acidisarcina polymorpha]AXC09814.1 Phosphatidate cytidylyltransferase [Acidisarcina polymorpha]